MKIKTYLSFEKAYKKRIAPNKKLILKTEERIILFKSNRKSSILKDHGLTGVKRRLRAFSITGDIRVVYYTHKDIVYFIDIGTHNQVYGK